MKLRLLGPAPLDFRFLDIMLVLLVLTTGFALMATKPGPSPAPLRIETPALPDALRGRRYEMALLASGGKSPYRWHVPILPPGLSLAANNTLAGVPDQQGRYFLELTVVDSDDQRASRRLTLDIVDPASTPRPLAIATRKLPIAQMGLPFDVTLAAEGGLAPYTWSAARLPPGISAEGPFLTGTPTESGIFDLSLDVVDSNGSSAQVNLDLQVLGARGSETVSSAGPIRIVSQIPAMVDTRPYSVQLHASGGVPPYQWKPLTLARGATLTGDGMLRFHDPSAVPDGWSMQVKVYDAAGSAAITTIHPQLVAVFGSDSSILLAIAATTGWILILLLLRGYAGQRLLTQAQPRWLGRALGACLLLGLMATLSHWVFGTLLFVAAGVVIAGSLLAGPERG